MSKEYYEHCKERKKECIIEIIKCVEVIEPRIRNLADNLITDCLKKCGYDYKVQISDKSVRACIKFAVLDELKARGRTEDTPEVARLGSDLLESIYCTLLGAYTSCIYSIDCNQSRLMHKIWASNMDYCEIRESLILNLGNGIHFDFKMTGMYANTKDDNTILLSLKNIYCNWDKTRDTCTK